MSDSIHSYNEKSRFWGVIVRQIVDFYTQESALLVRHLYSKGYSYQDVGNILGVTRQAVMQKFPKVKEETV